tara:strand:- start:524 stop:763 length:240 start_codon:yes stop_codon:yes gene_type:complete
MGVERVLHTKFGQILLSAVLGFGLASLFRKACKDRDCLIFKAPEQSKINEKIFKFDDKCYKFTPEVKRCDMTKKIVDFN